MRCRLPIPRIVWTMVVLFLCLSFFMAAERPPPRSGPRPVAETAGSGAKEPLVFLYMAQAGYQPRDILERVEEYQRERGVPVQVVFKEYEQMHGAILASAAADLAAYDVVLVDMIWVAEFAAHRRLSPLGPGDERTIAQGIPAPLVAAFRYHGALWAFPFLANMQVMYVNLDHLNRIGLSAAPATLEQFVRAGREMRARRILKHPFFDSWNKQEALVCEFTWMVGCFGGRLTDAGGRIRVDSAPALRALRFMQQLLDEGLMNPYSLQSDELFVSEVFLNGDAAFVTNWTYLMRYLDAFPYSKRRLTAVPIPAAAGGVSTVSGFQGLGVMRNSPRRAQAWDLIRFLASPDFQREHLSELPVWSSVWQEPEVRKRDPYLGIKIALLSGVHDRPQHTNYKSISEVLQEELHAALAGRLSAQDALRRAQARIERVRP